MKGERCDAVESVSWEDGDGEQWADVPRRGSQGQTERREEGESRGERERGGREKGEAEEAKSL